MDIIEIIKKNRPNLSANSLRTYKSILNGLANKLELKTLEDFKNKSVKILDHLKDLDPSRRKTTLAALVVLCEDDKEICEKYRNHMLADSKKANEIDEENEMTDKQLENWIDFNEVEKKYNLLEKTLKPKWSKENLIMKDLQELQNLIILGLYTLIPPRRLLDYTEFKLKNIDEEKDNYMSGNELIFNVYKTEKQYGQQKVNIPNKLKTILLKWKKINPNDYLLFDIKNNKLEPSQLTQRLNKLFDGKKVSVNILRHSYITTKVIPKEMPAIKELKEIAEEMGHSVSTQAIYRKIVKPHLGKK